MLKIWYSSILFLKPVVFRFVRSLFFYLLLQHALKTRFIDLITYTYYRSQQTLMPE